MKSVTRGDQKLLLEFIKLILKAKMFIIAGLIRNLLIIY